MLSFKQLSNSFILYRLVFRHPPSSRSTPKISARSSSTYAGRATRSYSAPVSTIDVVWIAATVRNSWPATTSNSRPRRTSSSHESESSGLTTSARAARRARSSGSIMRRACAMSERW